MKEYKLKINDNNYTVTINDVTDDVVLAEVNGKQHVVRIDTTENLPKPQAKLELTQTSALPDPSPQPANPSPTTTGSLGTITTPIPGQITTISITVGEKVRTGQKLLIIDAMKLENSITADMDGTVDEILVAEGDVVSQNQALIVLC